MQSKRPIIFSLLFAVIILGGFYLLSHGQRAVPVVSTIEVPDVSTSSPMVRATGTVAFLYPEHFPAEYLTPVDWPPRLATSTKAFTCVENTTDDPLAVARNKRMIDGVTYCVEEQSEGAAGSVYTSYVYSTPSGKGTLTAELTIRSPRCENYDEPKKTLCGSEQESFNLDALVGRMMKSVKF